MFVHYPPFPQITSSDTYTCVAHVFPHIKSSPWSTYAFVQIPASLADYQSRMYIVYPGIVDEIRRDQPAFARFKLTVNFLLRRVTRILWGVSHMTQQCLYLQCSLVNICLCSSFETSRRFLWGAFPLGKRNGIRQGLASSHVNSQWLVNPRRIVPEKTQWKWTRGMWQDSCDPRFLWKRQGMWKRSAASHINLQSHWTQVVFYLRKPRRTF